MFIYIGVYIDTFPAGGEKIVFIYIHLGVYIHRFEKKVFIYIETYIGCQNPDIYPGPAAWGFWGPNLRFALNFEVLELFSEEKKMNKFSRGWEGNGYKAQTT